MKKKNYLFIAAAVLLSFLTVTQIGCKKNTEPEPSDNETSIPETTKVIDQNVWNSNFISLDTTTYTFTFRKDLTNTTPLTTGDIIVSNEGYGYLRKITQIKTEGNEIKVYTSFASLSEAIENGSFSFNTVLSEQKIMKINYLREGVILDTSNLKGNEETGLTYEINTYLDDNKMIHLTGTFSLLPTVNAELEIKRFKVNKLKIEYVAEEQIILDDSIKYVDSCQKEIKLADVNFHPITLMIGTVPVIIVPELEVMAGINYDIEAITATHIDQTLSYTAGMLYENKDWTTYREIDKQLNYIPPTLTANANAKVYIKPQLKLKFYGTVAPYLIGELYGRIQADINTNPWWSLYCGVNLSAGVDVKIFGDDIFNYVTDPPIISYELLIADANDVGNNQAPSLPLNPNPTNNAIDVSVNTTLQWQCTDPDNDPLTYDVYFGQSNNPPLVLNNSTSTTYDPGTLNENSMYYWKIVAKDDHGHITEGPVWQFTTKGNNNSPELPSNPVPENNSSNISTSTTLQWQCTDPEGDPLTFDIYFGTSNPPTIAETNQSSFSFNPGELASSTQYYWKIVAKDNHGNQTEGPTWTFTTVGGGTGTFTDPRDGHTYTTVTIGNQTWMAENLNYETENSWCYDNDPANCDVYGRLYDWNTIMNGAASSNNVPSGVQGICPDGWHIPSDAEWDILVNYLGSSEVAGGKMKETGTIHWKEPNTGATNESGFSALPGGYRPYQGGFYNLHKFGTWWSTTEYSFTIALTRYLRYDNDDVGIDNDHDKSDGFSIRCVKN